MMKTPKLLVIIPDCLSDLIRKGEITERYYNPGNLFDEVHILMTNDDKPDPALLQKTVGSAKLVLHNLPYGRREFLLSLGFRPWLLGSWAEPAVNLARQIQPALIRCHGNYLNAFLAYQIKKKLGIPYIVSLHINFAEDPKKQFTTMINRIYYMAIQAVAKTVLLHADIVLPVYEPIVPYLCKLGVPNYEVAYNVINPTHLRPKKKYQLHHPVRLISVGRHFRWKNPENIIRAIQQLPEAQLTLVGDGPYQEYLENVVNECQLDDRVIFRRSVPNDELCEQLENYDIFVVHTEQWEISKAVLEALLTGMPVVINKRQGEQVPEFKNNFILMVGNTVNGYYQALKMLIENNEFRERLGREAFSYAWDHWSPEKTEAKYVKIYNQVVSSRRSDA